MLDIALDLGSGDETIVLIHGFTQRGQIWADVAEQLVTMGWRVLAPDLPAHGPNAQHDGAGMEDAARLVAQACGRATYVGYSLGARVVLQGLLDGLDEVERAVLVGVRLGFERGAASARRAADEDKARQLEDGGTSKFLDGWMASPFNARIPPDRRFRELRDSNRAVGLAASLRNCGGGRPRLTDDQLVNISAPVLAVTGEFDLPGLAADAERVSECIPQGEWIEIPGAGHAVPFEMEPDRFARLIDNYARRAR